MRARRSRGCASSTREGSPGRRTDDSELSPTRSPFPARSRAARSGPPARGGILGLSIRATPLPPSNTRYPLGETPHRRCSPQTEGKQTATPQQNPKAATPGCGMYPGRCYSGRTSLAPRGVTRVRCHRRSTARAYYSEIGVAVAVAGKLKLFVIPDHPCVLLCNAPVCPHRSGQNTPHCFHSRS